MEIIARNHKGSSHVRKGKPCQDRYYAGNAPGGAILAAADGHGGREFVRSGMGARLALYAALKVLPSDENDEVVAAKIKHGYDHLAARHLSRHPLTEREQTLLKEAGLPPLAAYGCTLAIAVLDYEKQTSTRYRLGDSEVLFVDEYGHLLPAMEADTACVGNATSSLCQDEATVKEHFRVQHFKGIMQAAVYTDGADPGIPEDAGVCWRSAAALFGKTEDALTMDERVDKLLAGTDHGDDQTLVIAYDPEVVEREKFQQGLAEETARGCERAALAAMIRRRARDEVYLRLLLAKAKQLKGGAAMKFRNKTLMPAAEEFRQLNEAIQKKQLEFGLIKPEEASDPEGAEAPTAAEGPEMTEQEVTQNVG